MKDNDVKAEDTTWEKVEAMAELEAAADEVASGSREEESDSEVSEVETKEEQGVKPYEVIFDKEYEFDDGSGVKKYTSIDMSGLLDLKTVDGEICDRVLTKLRHAPANKFIDTIYTKHIAMRATGLSVEFFNMLSIRDMQKVTNEVYVYFLRG